MSFVMIATGAASRSRVRTLSVRHLVLGVGFAALALVGLGAGLGYWLRAPAVQQAAAPERPHAALPFALEQLGTLSARLFKLESDAAQLSRRIGTLQKDEPAAPAGGRKPGGSGGPMLPPQPAAALDDIGSFDARLARIEEQIALVADAAALRNLDFMRLPTRLPIEEAELVSSFGNREDPITHRKAFHAGLDFAAEVGTPIRAAAGGVVVFAGFHPEFGRLVEIEHGNGLTTRYAHASRLLVQAGAVVAPGERIALVGTSGRSTGPHLHFEVLRGGEHADPRRYLAGL
jgi:murein DD-endopeptidase MepM/ murein hydrolase activator NlpD